MSSTGRATDLRVQIAGDATRLEAAVAQADGALGKLNESVKRSAAVQQQAWTAIGRGSKLAATSAEAAAAARKRAAEEAALAERKAALESMATVKRLAITHAESMSKIGASTVRAGGKISSFGSGLLTLTAPIAAVGAYAVKTAADFDRLMEMLHTQGGYSQSVIPHLSREVLKLTNVTGASADELAEGMYHVASGGIHASKSVEVLKAAAQGARLGFGSLDETTYALVSLMRSAPKDIHSAGEAMAMVNEIVGKGDMRIENFNEAMRNGLMPAAIGAGLGIRDVGAALDVMTQRGMPAGRSATALRQTFAHMQKMTHEAAGTLEAYGMTETQLAEDMRKPKGLLVALEDLKKHFDEAGLSSTEQSQAILTIFGGGRYGAGAQLLLQHLGELREQYKKLPEAGAALKRFEGDWKDFQKQPAQEFAKDWQKVSSTLLELGNKIMPDVIPAVKDTASVVGNLIEVVRDVPAPLRDVGLAFIGTGLVVGALAKPVGAVMKVIGTALEGAGALGKRMRANLEAQVPIAEDGGAAAGAAYGDAFMAAARESMSAGGVLLPAGVRSVPESMMAGAGATPMVAGTSTSSIMPVNGAGSLAESSVAKSGGVGVLARLRGAGGRLLKGGMIAGTGVLGSQILGGIIGGNAGSDVSKIGTYASLGAGFGTLFGPEGTIAGGVLGGLMGGLQTFGERAPEQGKEIGEGLSKAISSNLDLHLSHKSITGLEHELKKSSMGYQHAARKLGGFGQGKRIEEGEPNPGEPGVIIEHSKREMEKYHAELRETGETQGKQLTGTWAKGAAHISFYRLQKAAQAELDKMKPAGRAGAEKMMLAFVDEMEKQKRLPEGSLENWVTAMGWRFKHLGQYSREAAVLSASEWDGYSHFEGALKNVEGFVEKLHGEWQDVPQATKLTFSNMGSEIGTSLKAMRMQALEETGKTKTQALKAYSELKTLATHTFHTMRSGIEGEISHLSHELPKKGAVGLAELGKAYGQLKSVIRQEMRSGVLSTSEGIEQINKLYKEELVAIGVPAGHAAIKQVAHIGGNLAGGLKFAGGGVIGQLGLRGPDTVPAMLGLGEAVLNNPQQQPVETALAVSQAIGAQPYGSLDELFAGDRRMNFAGGGRAGGSRFARMVAKMNAINADHYPYVWGGGHNASFAGPYDCSGAWSAVLHAGGLLSRPEVSGELMSFGAPGPGRVTLYASPQHVYGSVREGGKTRFWGTHGAQGAGWYAGSALPGYTVRHVPLAPGEGGVGMIMPPKVGLRGAVGGISQGVLDRVAGAANRRLSHASVAGNVAGGPGGPHGTYNRGQLEALWRQAGGSPKHAHIMAAIALAESKGDPQARNSSGASGLWQIMMPVNASYVPGGQGNVFDPLANAKAAVAISKGGTVLSPWETYDTGAYKQFMARGGRAGAFAGRIARLASGGRAGTYTNPYTGKEQRMSRSHYERLVSGYEKLHGEPPPAPTASGPKANEEWNPFSEEYEPMTAERHEELRNEYIRRYHHPPPTGPSSSSPASTSEHYNPISGHYEEMTSARDTELRDQYIKLHHHAPPSAPPKKERRWVQSTPHVGRYEHLTSAQYSKAREAYEGRFEASMPTHPSLATALSHRERTRLARIGQRATREQHGITSAGEAQAETEESTMLLEERLPEVAPAHRASIETAITHNQRGVSRIYGRQEHLAAGESKRWGRLSAHYKKLAGRLKGDARKEAQSNASKYEKLAAAASKEAGAFRKKVSSARSHMRQAAKELKEANYTAAEEADEQSSLEAEAGKITGSQANAQTRSNINAALEGAYGPLTASGKLHLEAQRLSVDFEAVGKAIEEAALQVEAGVLTAAQGANAKRSAIEAALNGADGPLSEESRLHLESELHAVDFGAVSEANSELRLEQEAGLIGEQEAKEREIANINAALEGAYGPLDRKEELELLAERKKLEEENTKALESNTQALKEATEALQEYNGIASQIASTEYNTAIKALSDVISGQIAGVNYQQRVPVAGSGSAARY